MIDGKTTILLVDDHVVVRKGLGSLIAGSDHCIVLGDAGSLEEAKRMVDKLKPDLVLLDQKLPDGDGLELCAELKGNDPLMRIIILTAYQSFDLVERAMRSGADGVLLKTIDGEGILRAVNGVIDGNCFIDPMLVSSLALSLRNERNRGLESASDTRLLGLLAQGLTNKEIASELGLAEKTVRNRLSIMYKRLGVGNRTEAALLKLGTFDPSLRDK